MFAIGCGSESKGANKRGQKYFLEQVSEPGAKIQCRECNTFGIVRIHVQMFHAMSVQK